MPLDLTHDKTSAYWTPWFNAGHWVHYGVPGSPSECVWMPVWHEDAWFNYAPSHTDLMLSPEDIDAWLEANPPDLEP